MEAGATCLAREGGNRGFVGGIMEKVSENASWGYYSYKKGDCYRMEKDDGGEKDCAYQVRDGGKWGNLSVGGMGLGLNN